MGRRAPHGASRRTRREVRAAQKEAERLGTLQSDPYFDVDSMFQDVFEELPWHLREQRDQALAEAEAKRK
jgi:2-oxoisovalerate dehydrogenase E1 component alpha subunit